MSDPALVLQGAVVAALKGDAGVTAIVAGRIYDQPPAAALYPYVTLGEDQILPELADCYEGSTTTLTLHGWSRAVGFPEVKRLAGAIRAALHGAPLSLAGERLVDLAFTDSRFLRDPDGLTSHAVMTFTALTEPAD